MLLPLAFALPFSVPLAFCTFPLSFALPLAFGTLAILGTHHATVRLSLSRPRLHVHVPAVPRVKRVCRRDIRGARRLVKWNGGCLLLMRVGWMRVHLLVGMGMWRRL